MKKIILFITILSSLILKTTHSQQGWQLLTYTPPYKVTSAYFWEQNTGIICGGDWIISSHSTIGYVTKTQNSGSTWSAIFNTNILYSGIKFDDNSTGWIFGNRYTQSP